MSCTRSDPQPRTPARVALLGCGTVGSEVARHLLAGRLVNDTRSVELVKICVRRADLDRDLPPALFTERLDDVLACSPDAVIEAIGGLAGPLPAARAILSRGIPYITANKTLVAHHGAELRGVSQTTAAPLAYEAAVGASLPVIAAVRALRGDRVLSLRAVLNGTCNFILERLTCASARPVPPCTGSRQHEDSSFALPRGDDPAPSLAEAIRAAQGLGIAEPDPSADLSGRDSAEKLCVIAHELGWGGVRPDGIPTEGIEHITLGDCRAARRDGRAIRLVASIECRDDGPHFAVGPAMLDACDPLALLSGPENGVVIESELAGRIFLSGKGAGPGPTAAALLGDLAAVLGFAAASSLARGQPNVKLARAPVRAHGVRTGAWHAHPDVVFGALAASGVRSGRIELARQHAWIETEPAAPAAIRALAAKLGGQSCLVLPILDRC